MVDASWNALAKPKHYNKTNPDINYGLYLKSGINTGASPVINVKGVRQGCILSPCLFNFYAECIMQNAELEEA